MHDTFDVDLSITALRQQADHVLQVGDGVQIAGRELTPKAAIEVGAQRAVPRGAGQLADVVDVVDDLAHHHRLLKGDVVPAPELPASPDHADVKRRAEHTIALEDDLDLGVGELPLEGD